MRVIALFCLLAACPGAPVLAQEAAPPRSVERGDSVRVWVAPDGRSQPPTVVGRVLVASEDSLALSARRDAYGWGDLTRVQRLGENKRGEMIGVGVGIGLGLLTGVLAGLRDGKIGAPIPYGIAGAAVGATIGAVVGARSDRPWEDVPPNGGVHLRAVVSF